MSPLKSGTSFRVLVLSSVLLVALSSSVLGNDVAVLANKLVSVDFHSSIENLSGGHDDDVNNVRSSDVRIRSVELTSATESVTSAHPIESIISKSILRSLSEAAENVSSPKCKEDLQVAMRGLQKNQRWAIEMYDASVKEPSGIEHGESYQFGSFDECLVAFQHHRASDQTGPPGTQGHDFSGPAFNPQYCLADVTVQGYSVAALSSRDYKYKTTNSTRIFWGICIPDSCSSEDAAQFLATATGHEVSVRKELCTKETREDPLATSEIVFLSIMGGFFAIVVFCTFYNVYLAKRRSNFKCGPKTTLEGIVGAFSLAENLKKLTCEGSDELGLSCVNGIKAIAMLLILAGHSLIFIMGGPMKNSEFFEKQAKLVQNAFLLNSPLLVDTFLLLSGFLFARLLMLELEKRKGRINFMFLYIFRYIRLTPAYFAIIALYSTILPRLGSGPIWNYRIGLEKDRCVSSGWLNLLYINNYVGTEKLCMFQSWYLSADTQLFILAPLILYPLWKCRKVGVALLSLAAVVTTLIPFVVTYVKNIDPTFLVFVDEITDLSTNEYFSTIYIKTHMRATAYVFGLLTGYLVHLMQEKNLVLSSRTQTLLWITALIAGLGSMFSVTLFYHPEYSYSTLESAIYAALHRFGWSYLTGWVVLACVTGYAGGLRSFFSARALIPISRLTYCAYLTNGLVELYHASTVRSPKYLSVMNLTVETLGHTALTFFAALVLCLMFESPIHGIEKILLRRDSQRRKAEEDRQLNNTPSTSEESQDR